MRSITQDTIPNDLLIMLESFEKSGLAYGKPEADVESREYAAYKLVANGKTIQFRIAKTTPTKTGQFVTFWKRSALGPIVPFAVSDSMDYLIVCSRSDRGFGYFFFSKAVLLANGILSIGAKDGKRAIRVYTPWDSVNSKQAQKTQQWQLEHFVDFKGIVAMDLSYLFDEGLGGE